MRLKTYITTLLLLVSINGFSQEIWTLEECVDYAIEHNLQVKNISFAYKGGGPIHFPDFEFAQGDHALVLGQSGCGKTTILKLIAGFEQVDHGTYFFEHLHVVQHPEIFSIYFFPAQCSI